MSLGFAVSTRNPASPPVVEFLLPTDEQLLADFFQRREDAAFGAIVQRHGPLVYRVCRRVLRDANDADDAFQATFLVLVRKGASLRDPGRLASWLYGVAYRTASKIKVRAAIRIKHEHESTDLPATTDVDRLTLSELQSILNEEIGNLPEKYSLPLTLCYLEGLSNAQAATQLGWPEGSISRRLSRARELLRSRMVRRGLAVSAALVAAVFARPLLASPAPSLVSATISAGSVVARGVPLESVVSSQVAAAVRETSTGGAVSAKLIASAMLALGAVSLAVIVTVWQYGSPNDGPQTPAALFRDLTWSTACGHAAESSADVGMTCGRCAAAAAVTTPPAKSEGREGSP